MGFSAIVTVGIAPETGGSNIKIRKGIINMKNTLELVNGSLTCVVNGERIAFSSAQEAIESLGEKYIVKAIGAENNTVVVTLVSDMAVPNDMGADWVKEHVAKYGKEPNIFDGA